MTKLPGEWWITPDGPIFCDGGADILAPRHSDVILQNLLTELVGDLAVKLPQLDVSDLLPKDEDEQLCADAVMFVECMNSRVDELCRAGQLTEAQADDSWTYICEQVGWSRAKLDLIIGRDNQETCNLYGIKDLGWVRQHGNTAQFWQLTPSALRMWLDNMPEEFNDSDLDDISLDTLFQIEVVKSSRMFLNVPYHVLRRCRQTLSPLLKFTRFVGEPVPS